MTKYWRVTGLNEGEPIKPYVVDTDGEIPYICTTDLMSYGDKSRECEEISEAEYNLEVHKI